MLTTLTRVIMDNNPDLANTWTSLTPMGRLGEPEDLKGAIVRLSLCQSRRSANESQIYLASDASKFTTDESLFLAL